MARSALSCGAQDASSVHAITSAAGGAMVAELGYGMTFTAGAILVALGALVFWIYFHVPRGQLADRSLIRTAK